MSEEIKDIVEILELAKEEIENNDENVTATLDLEDLKALKNLYDLYQQEKEKNKELSAKLTEKICKGAEEDILEEYRQQNKDLQKQLNGAFDRGFISKDKVKEVIEKSFDEMLNHSNKFNCGDMQMLENNIVELLEEE